ncbi:MAG: Na/Pi cotransporter family protein [Planctomycetota bacterium]|jgi:phosphate:Na+ symporter
MDLKPAIEMIFSIVGGLGIFLLGMKNMSEGMQAVAGNRLRKLINAVTNNRLLACGVGFIVTCLIQSSSVTTVMVVGMVNASIMNLMQAIGVILGANIGTTITGWILVLKIGKYGLPLIGISALFFLFSKYDRIRYTASLFLGLGMVFFGLELMKNGFAPLKEMDGFITWFSRFYPNGYWGIIKCCLVGAVLTAIVQSSSATIGITIALVGTGVIEFRPAAALVLGVNIGTTITAFLASLGASTNARRASYAHTIINVFGAIWIIALFPGYIKVVEFFLGSDPTLATTVNGETTFLNAMRGVAISHTGFNIANVLVFLPFIGPLSRFLHWIAPEKHRETPHLTYLDVRMLDTPAIGIQQSQKELMWMAEKTENMLNTLKHVISLQKEDKKREEKLFKLEERLDVVQKEIVEFLSNIMTGTVSHEVINVGRKQLRMADEYESISDYVINILKLNLKIRNNNEQISPDGLREILDLHDHVADYIKFLNEAAKEENKSIFEKAQTQGQAITQLMKKYRSSHLDRVGIGTTTALKSLIYTDILTAYRKIKDHAYNIAEVIAGEK